MMVAAAGPATKLAQSRTSRSSSNASAMALRLPVPAGAHGAQIFHVGSLVAPAIEAIEAEQLRHAGLAAMSLEQRRRNIVCIKLLRRHVLPAEVHREVDPQSGLLAWKRAVPGVAVPHDRRARRHFDGNAVRIALIAGELVFELRRLAELTMTAR